MKTAGHYITAEVVINPQWSAEQGEQALAAFCIAMQQEAGCQMAMALPDNSDPRRFILWERYDSPAAHQHHFTQPHTQSFIDAEWVSLVRVYESTVDSKEHHHD